MKKASQAAQGAWEAKSKKAWNLRDSDQRPRSPRCAGGGGGGGGGGAGQVAVASITLPSGQVCVAGATGGGGGATTGGGGGGGASPPKFSRKPAETPLLFSAFRNVPS